MNLIEERTIALAGVVQACAQVQALARSGQVEKAAAEPLLQSVLVLDAVNTPAVYGGLRGVGKGLALLAEGLLHSPQNENVEVLRYAMSLLHLQHQLYRDDRAFAEFGQAVEQLSAHGAEEFEEACSDVYQRFISNMRPQIIVQGEQDYLQQPEIPAKVRAMLLAGIRSAVLWQQKGGSRFKLIWQRTRMQNAARSLLGQSYAH
ncbi:MAG: high frequency lysogenization protein HflD [Pseudomonadota bacterium]